MYYKRYIEDIFRILVDSDNQTWNDFKDCLNQFGSLCWNIEDLTLPTNYLDSKIGIKNNKILPIRKISTYIYTSHLASCFKGLITGELICYWTQNTSTEDFIKFTEFFIQRLVKWGHSIKDLIPLLQSATASLDSPHFDNNNNQESPTRKIRYSYTGSFTRGILTEAKSVKSTAKH
jgi:hypothetical protein